MDYYTTYGKIRQDESGVVVFLEAMFYSIRMLIITGIFENERFIPDRPVSIPQRKKVVVTIEEDGNTRGKPVKHSAFGQLNAYANPSLIPEEKGAWETAAIENYELH